LKEGELCVCEIIDALDKAQPTVSHHLNIPDKCGLLKRRKRRSLDSLYMINNTIVGILDDLLKTVKKNNL